MKEVNDFPVLVKCNIISCDKKVAPRRLLPGQSYIITGDNIEVYHSDEHWQQHLKEVMPHH